MLGADVNALAPVRHGLIEKAMIRSPSYRTAAFSVPFFGQFTRRIMPGTSWRRR